MNESNRLPSSSRVEAFINSTTYIASDQYHNGIFTMFDDGDLFNTCALRKMELRYIDTSDFPDSYYLPEYQPEPNKMYTAIAFLKQRHSTPNVSKLQVYFSNGKDGFKTPDELKEFFFFFVIYKRNSTSGTILVEDNLGIASELASDCWDKVVDILLKNKPDLDVHNTLIKKCDYELNYEELSNVAYP